MKKIFVIAFVLLYTVGYGQTKRLKILNALNYFTDEKYPGASISTGDVIVEHEGATIRCDKAYIYQDTNILKAMGNVVMNQGDTVIQYSKYADYDGEKKLATSWGNVILKDQFMTLRTDTLHFDRTAQKLYYNYGGTIKDTTNLLKSQKGTYFLETNKFQAISNVDVTNEDSKLNSNHLDYYTSTGIAQIYGPSTIDSDQQSIYTETGHHNTKTNISHFLKNSKIYFDNQTIEGDSIYYDKNIDFASATGNIRVIDTLNNSIVKGGYAEFFKLKDSVFITDKAIASSLTENDSMHIHGDTLLITGKIEERIMRAFNHVKFYKSDLQGKCDSLISFEKTGLTKLLIQPVLWAEGNQITGDVIHLISNPETEKLDSLKIMDNAFMIQKDTINQKQDSTKFSQLKGRNMYGKFENNQLISLNVVGNSEVIFYIRSETQELMGIDKMATSTNIFISLLDNEINTIKYFGMPDGKTYPPSEFIKLDERDRLLDGFIWREKERPLKKMDILIHDKVIPKIEKKPAILSEPEYP